MNNILDQFQSSLPAGAYEDIKRQGRVAQTLEDGVTVLAGHDKGVAYRFYVHTVFNPRVSKTVGYEYFDEIEMIEWLIDKNNKPTERVNLLPEELLKRSFDGKEVIGGRYFEAYKRFKEGRDAVGTPLRKWGVLSDGNVASLEAAQIFTVEQLAEITRDRIAGVYPEDVVEAHDRAVLHMKSRDQVAVQNEQARKMADMEAELEKLRAMVKGDATPEPKKRGRKPSVKQTEEVDIVDREVQ